MSSGLSFDAGSNSDAPDVVASDVDPRADAEEADSSAPSPDMTLRADAEEVDASELPPDMTFNAGDLDLAPSGIWCTVPISPANLVDTTLTDVVVGSESVYAVGTAGDADGVHLHLLNEAFNSRKTYSGLPLHAAACEGIVCLGVGDGGAAYLTAAQMAPSANLQLPSFTAVAAAEGVFYASSDTGVMYRLDVEEGLWAIDAFNEIEQNEVRAMDSDGQWVVAVGNKVWRAPWAFAANREWALVPNMSCGVMCTFTGVALTGGRGYATTDSGELLRLNSEERSLERVLVAESALQDVAFNGAGLGWAVGLDSMIVRFENGAWYRDRVGPSVDGAPRDFVAVDAAENGTSAYAIASNPPAVLRFHADVTVCPL